MRIKPKQLQFLKTFIKDVLPEASVYIFGSRLYEDQKGGDIDVLVIGKRQLLQHEKRSIKIEFYKKFGEQKIDIVSFNQNASSTFKDLVMEEAVQI